VQAIERLDRQQLSVLKALNQAAKRQVAIGHEYRYVAAGFSVVLSKEEAVALASVAGVASVMPDRTQRLHSDAGPSFIGATSVWAQANAGSRGEGRVLGLIDSGINAAHRAFADVASDGYNHSNPRGRTYGLCTQGRAVCNDKLIGIYNFTNEGSDGSDLTGHGSHVGSIAVGNPNSINLVNQTSPTPQVILVSGVAPRAALISYKACVRNDDGGPGTCALSDLIAAIDRATADQVDVINYSIGGDARDPWLGVRSNQNDDARAFLNARFAGVLAVVSAGNDGPLLGTMASPANAPWVLSVANSTHNRRFINRLINLTSSTVVAPGTLTGVGLTGALPARRIVHAREFGSALCGQGSAQDFPPTGVSNPFAANTFQGQIVICERGIYARVAKGFNLAAAGAGGMILVNTPGDGESINGDDHFLPAVHLPASEASRLLEWYDRTRAAQVEARAAISGQSRDLNDSYADRMASSSSRGPNPFAAEVLKPNISAPGSDILAAIQTNQNYDFKSGTSMAAPHVAGAALLLKARNPNFAPAQLEGALLSSADPTAMRNPDGVTAAGGIDRGAGRVRVDQALRAGLFFPVTRLQFEQADPQRGGVPGNINSSLLHWTRCFAQCSGTRSVAALGAGGTFRVRANPRVSVLPAEFNLSAGGTQILQISFNVDDPAFSGRIVSERVLIDSTDAAIAPTALTLSAYVDPGSFPARITLNASQSIGRADSVISGVAPLTQASVLTSALGPATEFTLTAPTDATPNDPYDGLNLGSAVVREILSSASSEVPLVIEQIGGISNTRTYVLEPRGSTSLSASQERCVLDPARNARTCILENASSVHRLVLQNLSAADAQVTYRFFRPVGELNRSLSALIPGRTVRSSSFALRVLWDAPLELRANAKNFGLIRWNAFPGASQAMAYTVVELNRGAPFRDPPSALSLTSSGVLPISPAETREFIVDIPVSNQLNLRLQPGSATDQISVAFSRASSVPAGPAVPTVATPSAFTPISNSDIRFPDARPGERWHLFVRNLGESVARVSYSNLFGDVPASPVIADGPWFNATRSGSGLNLTRKDGVLVAGWFTYLEDNSSVWYFLNDQIAPRAAVWDVPITRTAWDGTMATGNRVGRAQLTLVAPNELRFAWQLNGELGFETLQPIASAPACPRVNGVATSYSGSWFRPERPGYGVVFYVTSQAELSTLFAYDASGVPRWAIGSSTQALADTPFQMAALSGFCPSCARTEPLPSPAGTLTRRFLSVNQASYQSAVSWPSPLTGAWPDSGTLQIASEELRCPP